MSNLPTGTPVYVKTGKDRREGRIVLFGDIVTVVLEDPFDIIETIPEHVQVREEESDKIC